LIERYEEEDLSYLDRESYDSAAYHLQNYNQEVLETIKNKIKKILKISDCKDKQVEAGEKEEEEKLGPYEPPVTKKFKSNPEIEDKGALGHDDNREGYEYNENSDEENDDGKPLPDKIDCVALMLKRRYGAKALSPDTLKGSDGALYHYLKKDFKVEVQPILFEQWSNYNGKMESIKIRALKTVGEVEYEFSSDEEVKVSGDNKSVPQKNRKNNKMVEIEKHKKSIESTEKLTACFVRGVSSKSLIELVDREYIECTGNEAQLAQYVYLHAALFVYPKSSKK